jgi:hypothetical protein
MLAGNYLGEPAGGHCGRMQGQCDAVIYLWMLRLEVILHALQVWHLQPKLRYECWGHWQMCAAVRSMQGGDNMSKATGSAHAHAAHTWTEQTKHLYLAWPSLPPIRSAKHGDTDTLQSGLQHAATHCRAVRRCASRQCDTLAGRVGCIHAHLHTLTSLARIAAALVLQRRLGLCSQLRRRVLRGLRLRHGG